ncbi:MarR family transcriptional regulator [Pinirhizobacter sp.]|jgi:DNA-binding MarR family transcriptional regulator|uniref:MarR family winged helix-turn-helix transcriptional regulator n=1 Tax=Pinirhizobacter sp. TaxID=2950432 RepID=UPI002F3FC686
MNVMKSIIASMLKLPPDMDPLAANLIGAIFPIIKDGQTGVVSAMAVFDLTFSQFRILFVLDSEGTDLAVNELAERISLSLPAAGRAVDAMVKMGLVSRREDDIDRRVKRIALTAAGSEALAQIADARRGAAERFVKKLSDEERAALTTAVATLSDLTRKYFAGSPWATGNSHCSPESPK